MASTADNWGFQMVICKALKIDPSATKRITILIEALSITRIEIEQNLTKDSAETLKKVFELSSWTPSDTGCEGQ